MAEIHCPGALHLAFARSSVRSGRLLSVDLAEINRSPDCRYAVNGEILARELPTAADRWWPYRRRPLLALDRVEYLGEPLAAVVASNLESAIDLVQLIRPVYETNPEPDRGDELGDPGPVVGTHRRNGVVTVVLRARIPLLPAAPLECRATLAYWARRQLYQWLSSQDPGHAADVIAHALNIPADRVHLQPTRVGGSFGGKATVVAEEILAAYVSMRLARPVRWSESRAENLVSMIGRGQEQIIRMTGTSAGRILSIDLDCEQCVGAYRGPAGSVASIMEPVLAGPYPIPRKRIRCTTRTAPVAPVGAYRGFGNAEANYARERAIDMFSSVIGRSPGEVRARNLDARPAGRALRVVLERIGYEDLLAEQRRMRQRDDHVGLGIGLSAYTASTGRPGDEESVRLTLLADGRIELASRIPPQGHGHTRTWVSILSSELLTDDEQIRVVRGVVDGGLRGRGTGASRALRVTAPAIRLATERFVASATTLLAERCRVGRCDIRLVPGGLRVADRSWTWADIADLAFSSEASVSAEGWFTLCRPGIAQGVHAAVVRVDFHTGDVVLERHVSYDDVGERQNTVSVDAQIYGGIVQAIGEVMFEEGSTLYQIPKATRLPVIEILGGEGSAAEPVEPSGCGEVGIIGALPALHNAIIDALPPHCLHLDMPCTPARLWRAATRGCRREPSNT